MSGGSLDYCYRRVHDAALTILQLAESPTHRAFAAHLMKVSEALRAMEWMLSCDTSPGSEVAAIRAVLSEGAELEAATERAREALAELQSALSANAPSSADAKRSAGLNC